LTVSTSEARRDLSDVVIAEAPTGSGPPAGRCRLLASPPTAETEGSPVGPPTSGARGSGGTGRLRRCAGNAVLIAGFYTLYAAIRNTKGGRITPQMEATAQSHGLFILDIERRLGLDHEAAIQSAFLHLPTLMKASNIFYATAHFSVTACVLIGVTLAGGRHHSRWRNILGVSTALSLVGFAAYPTMPPRLLPDHPALIDTLSEIGGFWSFQTPAIERIADPFAAIPSLHVVWATWVACALWSRLRTTWMRAAAISYPLLTSVVVVATANHYVLDIVAALAVVGLAMLIVRAVERRVAQRQMRQRASRRDTAAARPLAG
jgi:hypothetical protein